MRIRQHLTYANVAATLALAGVIGGGGAYAAGVIDSADIENNTVRSKDVKNRVGIKGRDVQERTLDAAEFAPLAGDQTNGCDPTSSARVVCAKTKVRLTTRSRLLVVATGDFFTPGSAGALTCRISVDGDEAPVGASPGDEVGGSSLGATDGFATTLVTGRLPQGMRDVAIRCSQSGGGDGRLGSASIAVLGISE